jgi:tetratricopeptide (TPR) repeat protein
VFAREAKSDEQIMKALDDVVLLKVDAEKGEGPELKKQHAVQGYPTFVLTNAAGEVLDRWIGYEKNLFLTQSATSLADPTTIDQKRERFAKSPTAGDAERLANLSAVGGEYGDAVKYFRKAATLGSEKDHTFDVFDAIASGYRGGQFTIDEVRGSADAVMAAAAATPRNRVETYFGLRRLESKEGNAGMATPYLNAAMAATEGREELARARIGLEIDHALRVTGDKDRAYELKVASMPEGWKDDPSGLNSVAWWCFENNAALADGRVLAERGVELAPAGSEKAMILDTLAEICNAQGNCPEAVSLIRQALENQPDSEYYQKQLVRFEELLALTN